MPLDPEESPGFLLWHVTLRWQREMVAALGPLGLTHVQFVLLATTWWLNSRGEDPNQLGLARQAGTDVKMTSEVLRKLEAKGLIVRTVDAGDTRARRLRVTGGGAELATAALAAVEAADAAFFRATPDLAALVAMLRPLAGPPGRASVGDMTADSLPGQMRSAAMTLLAALDEEQRDLAALPFADDDARRWLEYRPQYRPGACLAQMSVTARKAAHRLLATGLSDHAFAQAMGIIALEEVLDRWEQGRQGRHSGDYWVSVFGDPGGATGGQPWSWRFEGHHLSVTMTVAGDQVSPAPVFLGADPARVSYAGRPVSRPLGPEEDLARALLDAMGPAGRAVAVVAAQAPPDIRSGTSARAAGDMEPLGLPAGRLGPGPRAVLGELVALYLDRLPPGLAAREASRLAASELHFAWEGPLTPGTRHYYRIQGDDLLIEYDNTTDDGNHAHTVLRRPRSDFGDDVLAAHYDRAHP